MFDGLSVGTALFQPALIVSISKATARLRLHNLPHHTPIQDEGRNQMQMKLSVEEAKARAKALMHKGYH